MVFELNSLLQTLLTDSQGQDVKVDTKFDVVIFRTYIWLTERVS